MTPRMTSQNVRGKAMQNSFTAICARDLHLSLHA
jgi:hypothetical protein